MKKLAQKLKRYAKGFDPINKGETYWSYSNEGEKTNKLIEEVRNAYASAKAEAPSIELATDVARLFDAYVLFYEEFCAYDQDIPNPDKVFSDFKIADFFGGEDVARNHIHSTMWRGDVLYKAYTAFIYYGDSKTPYQAISQDKIDV